MTVGELKEKLKELDDNKKVYIPEDGTLVRLGVVYVDADGDVILEE